MLALWLTAKFSQRPTQKNKRGYKRATIVYFERKFLR